MDAAPNPNRALPVAAALLRLASDQRLVDDARAGSEAAFEALYHRHRRPVLAYCRRMLGSADDADDAMQQTFLAAYYALGRLERPVALRAWLYGIARHRCQSVLRARANGSVEGRPAPAAAGPDAEFVTRADLQAMLADMARLPDDQRFAIIQAELGGVSHDQIAQALGCRRDKVKALIFQARASLTANRAAREMPCEEIQRQLVTLRGAALRRATLRRHLANCGACTEFREQLRGRRRSPRSLLPAFFLSRGILGPLFGGTSETTLSAGAIGSGGLAATALAALALHGGDIVHSVVPMRHGVTVARSSQVPTPTGRTAMPASLPPLSGAGLTRPSPPPSRREPSNGTASAPKQPDGQENPAEATRPASPPAPEKTPGTDQSRIESGSDKATTPAEDTPARLRKSTPADAQPSDQAPEQADADAQGGGAKHAGANAPPGRAKHAGTVPPAGGTKPATASPNARPPRSQQPAPQADAPHPAPAAPAEPSAGRGGPPAAPGIANAPNGNPAPEAHGPPAGHEPGPASPPAAAHSGEDGG